MSTLAWTPSLAPATLTRVRIACAVRPRRPMTRPMSSGATCRFKRMPPRRSSVSITTASGSFDSDLARYVSTDNDVPPSNAVRSLPTPAWLPSPATSSMSSPSSRSSMSSTLSMSSSTSSSPASLSNSSSNSSSASAPAPAPAPPPPPLTWLTSPASYRSVTGSSLRLGGGELVPRAARLQKPFDPLGGLGAVDQPLHGLLIVDLDHRVGLGGRGAPGGVGADDLEEPAVARRPAVGRHDPVGRLLLLAHPHQAELHCHELIPSTFEIAPLRRSLAPSCRVVR